MTFRLSLVSIALGCALSLPAAAQQTELAVTKAESEETLTTTVEAVLDADALSKRSITNIEDTARYIPGVQVSDTGNRFGNDGFNIRGLEGDAVAITIDGVNQGETLNPGSFAAYGMFGSSRGEVEIEHVKAVTITKGPSAVAQGSGSLAGSVTYVTNDAADFLPDAGDDTTYKLKTGFDARSDEWLVHGTLANRTGKLDSLIQYTMRDSNEVQAHDNGADIDGPGRGQADPMDSQVDALLLKFAYNLSDTQQVGVVYENTERETDGIPLSRQSSVYFDFTSQDENNRERIGAFYTDTNLNTLLADSVDIRVNYQELYTSGVTNFLFVSGGADPILRSEDRNFTQEQLSFNIDFAKSINGDVNHEVIYGVSYQRVDAIAEMFDRRFAGTTVDSRYFRWLPHSRPKLCA
ncbi:TonB-dependent receptor plug domain-containing protein [Alteromonas gracilis]|uniref:TonB-dependent receptor plug domain-containing protein n=1 Tax=Alteromonas gracilis TaxID=1479524 RepID=UPI00321BE363